MAESGTQPPERQAEVGAADLGTEQGGRVCLGIRADLLGGGTIGPDLRVREMGHNPADAEGDGRIPP